MTKACRQCGEDFETYGPREGRVVFCSELCKKESDRVRERIRASRKRDVLNRYKRRKGCIDCGYRDDHRALEFDHKDDTTKLATVASLTYASWRKIKEEVAKCVVRCCNCHAIATHERGQYIY